VANQNADNIVNDVGKEGVSSSSSREQHKLAGLKCQEKYGGPQDDYAEKEMVFWSDIPSDSGYKSPFFHRRGRKVFDF